MQESIKKQMLRERIILVKTYQGIRRGSSRHFETVQSLAEHHGVSRKWVWQLNCRWKDSNGQKESLPPRKRGPKRPWNRPIKDLERLVVSIHRRLGKTPAQIHFMLNDRDIHISVSGIRNILGRYPLPEPVREVAERYEKKTWGSLDTLI